MYRLTINSGLKKLKWVGNDLPYSCGLKSLPNQTHGKRILVYHGVTENALTDINARFISTQRFEQEISYFKKHFNVVSLKEYIEGAEHPNKLTVAITFDDGYLNNLTEALPILEKHQLPATFFITTIQKENYPLLWADALDLHRYTSNQPLQFQEHLYRSVKNEYKNGHSVLKHDLKTTGWQTKKELVDLIIANNTFMNDTLFSPYFQLMSEKDIQQLSKSEYATIGSHGVYHNCLTQIPIKDAVMELKESKSYLENLIQKEVNNLAYPDGDYNSALIDEAQKVGYQIQLVVDYLYEKDEADTRILPRFGINPYIRFNNQIRHIIDGKY